MIRGTDDWELNSASHYVTYSLAILFFMLHIFLAINLKETVMMPVIRVSDAAFANLKHIATWLEADTPAQTIDLLVHNEMERLGLERDSEESAAAGGEGNDNVSTFERTPGLSFTRILSASINGRALPKTNWATLLKEVIQTVQTNGISGSQLVRELNIPAKIGSYEDEGFKYNPILDISVQGQSAADAWKEIQRLADKHGILVELEFQWKDNKKAEYPNRIGRLQAGV